MQVRVDSPVFGSSKMKAFKHSNQPTPPSARHSQQVIAIIQIEKNLKKLIRTISYLILNKKRDIFNQLNLLKQPALIQKNITVHAECMLIQVQRRLIVLFTILNSHLYKNRLMGWRELTTKAYLKNNQSVGSNTNRRSSTIHNNTDGRGDIRVNSQKGHSRKQDWKENSTVNVMDLANQNKKLKNQIQKQQIQEEEFINKMKILLDSFQKVKGGGKKKK